MLEGMALSTIAPLVLPYIACAQSIPANTFFAVQTRTWESRFRLLKMRSFLARHSTSITTLNVVLHLSAAPPPRFSYNHTEKLVWKKGSTDGMCLRSIHTAVAMGQSLKTWVIVSVPVLHRGQDGSKVNPLLQRASFVRMAPFVICHNNNFTLFGPTQLQTDIKIGGKAWIEAWSQHQRCS